MHQVKSTSNDAVIVHGPAGCGKSRHAAALARHYGKTVIIDDWQPRAGASVPANALALTNASPPPDNAIEFSTAMRAAGVATRR
jgi:cytidylate kinase